MGSRVKKVVGGIMGVGDVFRSAHPRGRFPEEQKLNTQTHA